MTTGRFAPSPSSQLHLGNLRTALLAWCFARSEGGRFLMRMEDLTSEALAEHESAQLADLAALGIDHDGPVLRQSERVDAYDAAIARLTESGLTYPCFCSRREIREATRAPHGPAASGAYPGTCADIEPDEQQARLAQGHRAAVRLRARGQLVALEDERCGRVEEAVDDFVLRRGDGVAAYNLAVVVDDADQGVDQVVRGDDLLHTTPRQVLLQRLLGFETPRYIHVPLVLGEDGDRLAKRHGALTLEGLGAAGLGPDRVLGLLAWSLGLAGQDESVSVSEILERFDPAVLPGEPWVFRQPLG